MAPQYFFAFNMMNKLDLRYRVKFVEHYGSTVYKTRTEKSDIDLKEMVDQYLKEKDFFLPFTLSQGLRVLLLA